MCVCVCVGGGGGFRLKPQMKVSFVWMWPYRILDARAQCKRNVHDVWCMCSFKSAGLLGRCTSSLRRWPRVAHQPKQPSSSSWQYFLFACCVVCWWYEVWAPFQGRRTTLSLRSLGRETVLHSLDVAFSAPSRKSSFLRVLHSCAKADVDWLCFKEILALAEQESERFSPWQSENYHLRRDLRATECPTDKNGESWSMCSRTGQGLHVCMRAYLRNLLGSAARCWPNPCLHLFNFFVRCL